MDMKHIFLVTLLNSVPGTVNYLVLKPCVYDYCKYFEDVTMCFDICIFSSMG